MENKLLEILGYAGNDVEGMVLCKFFRLCVLTIPSGKAAPDVDVNTFRRSVQMLRSYAQHMGFMVFNVVNSIDLVISVINH